MGYLYDYSKLKGRIVEKYGTQAAFSQQMGFSKRTASLKLNNKVAFTQEEIRKAAQLLELSGKELDEYFFKPKVQFV